MSGDALTPAQAHWGADVIGRQLRHLSRLLDQLLDVARVQRGKIKLETEPVDMVAIARQSAEAFEARAKGRDFKLALPDAPVWVSGDPVRLTQVVENLLDNAYKYTSDGGRIRLSVDVDQVAIVTVSDDGRGIDDAAIAHLFEPFFQEARARAEAPPGLGLGLAMVDNLVRLHGGSVAARSEGAGRGAEFQLRLPLARSAARQTAADHIAASQQRPLRLLIIEDDADSANAFASLLKSLKHEPDVVYDGRSGVARAMEGRFDLAFIDIGLPDIDGEEVARRIREALGSQSPRLVALTGHVEADDSELFDDYLLKPVGRERVERLLRSRLGQTPSRRARSPERNQDCS